MAPKQKRRNWLDLPFDVTANILNRIGIAEILENAQLVCTAWYQICKDPTLWRVVNTDDLLFSGSKLSAANMCKQAVDRSQGHLVDITFVRGLNPQIFPYVADRSSQLRRLEMVSFSFYGCSIRDVCMKYPLLEELNLYLSSISKKRIETFGRFCPMIKTFKMNEIPSRNWAGATSADKCSNAKVIAIGENFVELRHLELIGNCMTNIGLQVILDNCVRLETLDLRGCFNIDLKGDLGKRCSKQIKNLKLPNDSLEDYPYFKNVVCKYAYDDYDNYDDHDHYYDYDDYY